MLTNRTNPKAADNPLDALRNTIELDNRFKTAFHGYDKRCVQDYIAQLTAVSEEVLAAKSEELYRLKEENAELLSRAHNQERLLSDARADERRKLEGAISIKESMLDGLRQTNQRLEDENHRLQLQISDLKARLAETNSRHADANASVASLNSELSELLAGKFAECSGIISSWQNEASKLLDPQGSCGQSPGMPENTAAPRYADIRSAEPLPACAD